MVLLSKNNGPDHDNSRRNKSDHWPSLRKQMMLTPLILAPLIPWVSPQQASWYTTAHARTIKNIIASQKMLVFCEKS